MPGSRAATGAMLPGSGQSVGWPAPGWSSCQRWRITPVPSNAALAKAKLIHPNNHDPNDNSVTQKIAWGRPTFMSAAIHFHGGGVLGLPGMTVRLAGAHGGDRRGRVGVGSSCQGTVGARTSYPHHRARAPRRPADPDDGPGGRPPGPPSSRSGRQPVRGGDRCLWPIKDRLKIDEKSPPSGPPGWGRIARGPAMTWQVPGRWAEPRKGHNILEKSSCLPEKTR